MNAHRRAVNVLRRAKNSRGGVIGEIAVAIQLAHAEGVRRGAMDFWDRAIHHGVVDLETEEERRRALGQAWNDIP